MTSVISEMARMKKIHADAAREIDGEACTTRFIRECAALKEEFRVAAVAFNAIRDELEKSKNGIWKMEVDAKAYVSELTSICGNDTMSFVAKCWDVNPSEVEDAKAFERLFVEICKKDNPLLRMQKCVKAKAALDEAIKGWKSKLEAMKERAGREDANQNERDICERKSFTMYKTVETLKVRRESVSRKFFEAKRDVLAYVEKQTKKFEKED